MIMQSPAQPSSIPRRRPLFVRRHPIALALASALAALAHIFRTATKPGDVLVSSIMAILCAAPSRIGEVFLLCADCEVIQNDSQGTAVYGLRWYPEKGAPPQTKPIITSMVDVVREALNKIRALNKRRPDRILLVRAPPDRDLSAGLT